MRVKSKAMQQPLDEQDDEDKAIEREYRLKVFIYAVLLVCGLVWAISKLLSAHFALTEM